LKNWTYTELSTKVEQDLAIEEELFIQPTEMLGYFNEAIDRAEQMVLTLYEDYFLTKSTVSLVQGTEEYDLPSDIYAEKIRRVIFKNGTDLYTVDRIRDWKKFEEYAESNLYASSELYRYFLYNPSAGQYKMLIVPTSRESGAYLTLWYLRNAAVLSLGTDILDIPEAANFIMQYVKVRIMEKEGHFALDKAIADLQTEKDMLESTLANMAPDANNEIEMDASSYREMN
jgi:hypothetical protein